MDDKWKSLRDSLENEEYPILYLFKFIIPNDEEKLSQLKKKFNEENAEIEVKYSKTKKYISLSVKEVMTSADRVIETYKSVGEIEGIITL